MTEDAVIQIFKDAMILVFKLAGPLLIISMLVGLVIAIIQAATQVHEQTLSFVPKLVVIALLLVLLASFYIASTDTFVTEIFDLIGNISTQTVSG
ncbi:MAG: flagellar biosynthetic protein FliQ [Oscillospiraceae bacterium]|nr:flagellar type III secretion system protein FliQ [Oscillospiraceae bacterium]MCI7498968.1 flagellar type III secretion system protein FliQ [Oscillospiraceae bacterium]MDD7278399.1 flagellar biosynthetic protein FliQ [Oscillospiraceae bacterium]MDY2862609.1 flagellar biosynthetic protein FliQ [Oscillospiraceae bacterium]